MDLIDVVASPAERWQLFEVVFQKGEGSLVLSNPTEGRAFRTFVESMGLGPIRETLTRFGRVDGEMASDESSFRVFRLSVETIQFYRHKLANLPRNAIQEVVGGGLFSSLHALGGPYHREPGFTFPEGWQPAMWARELETWTPELDVSAKVLNGLRMPVRTVQDAIERFQSATEDIEMPFPLRAELLRFHEAILLGVKAALEAEAPGAIMDAAGAS